MMWAGLLGLALGACRNDASERAGTPLIEVTGPELVERIRARGARFVVVNVWATWCGPCREEFPYIQRVTRSFADRGVDLVFVSTDFEAERPAAVEFLEGQGADLPSLVKTGPDEAFIEALSPAWTGALPFTVIFDAEASPVKAWQGRVEEEDLRDTLQELVSEAPKTQRVGKET